MNQEIFVLVEHVQEHILDITYTVLAQARKISAESGDKVIAVLLCKQSGGLTSNLAADEVLCFEHPALGDFTAEAYQIVLCDLLQARPPRGMLFGETTIGGETAAGISARLELPLISSCAQITPEHSGPGLKFTSQVCGGKIMLEGEIDPQNTFLATMLQGTVKANGGKSAQPPKLTLLPAPELSGLRVAVKHYVEPPAGDVDISKENLLVSVGRGIQQKDNLELAEELAQELGAVLVGTRPVIDQTWLPTSRLVGKSGKSVKGRLYLALGISGAPEHVEGIVDNEMIIAVNTDPKAPIFDVARYGAVIDVLDLLPVLIEKVREAKETIHA